MKILIVGSGGREHAIAWKVSQSPRLDKLFIAPGNAGTASLGENVAIDADNIPELVKFSVSQTIDLVIVGPEIALAAGLVDKLNEQNIMAFGPTSSSARIEASKSFSKNFMQRHRIPSARFAVFSNSRDAVDYLDQVTYPIVVKASGLSAGKGVILPQSIAEAKSTVYAILDEHIFGTAGDEVIIEERLEGEEFSLLAFTDGFIVRSMPPAQDHKRLLDNDQGPNTGGMGAYAPAPGCSEELVKEIEKTILQPVIDGMRTEGSPYQGVLYAGLMITADGPKVLEFNCRFGDPETQVLLPLLKTDLINIAEACVKGDLIQVVPEWRTGAAVTIVLASGGYPGKYQTGIPISGLDQTINDVVILHAGTRSEQGKVVTSGGRVLNVTGFGDSLEQVIQKTYQAVELIDFSGMTFRRDIGYRALQRISNSSAKKSAYAQSGVDIDAGNLAVSLMRKSVKSTYNSAVLAGIGSFGGLYDAGNLQKMSHPVLVASTDGVGTKVRLAASSGRLESIGEDIVNHCIDDILVQGAYPLFFLDYFACSKLDPQIIARIVSGISSACREANCVLLGGETAEMPGVYQDGEFDLAGTIIGVVEKENILPSRNIVPGDLLIGLASNGPHTNGFSLIRSIFKNPQEEKVTGSNELLIDALMRPHRSYLHILRNALELDPSPVKALAHITGGGFMENIPRVLPDQLRALIHYGSWPIPPLFSHIQKRGEVSQDEMFRVFNQGIGMVIVVEPGQLKALQGSIPEEIWVIGEIATGEKGVVIE